MIEYGVSAVLQAEFEMLRETPSNRSFASDNGSDRHDNTNQKYTTKTIDKLAQYIVCRNYGKACLELAHLCWPIVRHEQYTKGLLQFFWIDEAISPKQFRTRILPLTQQNLCLPALELNDMGLLVTAPVHSFTISATRVALLSALLEFLVNNLQGVLNDIEEYLRRSDSKCVSELASYLQKKLYAFLKEHLPTANLQQKFRYIHQWVTNNQAEQRLNDTSVLNFWQAAIGEEGYVKFESALVDIVDYQFASEQVKVARELSFSEDNFESFAVDGLKSTWLHDTIFEFSRNDVNPPLWLLETPKFMSKKEFAAIALLYDLHANIAQFPISVLRAQVFGQWQNQIIQQTRSKNHKAIDKPKTDYASYIDALDDWRKQAINTLLSCAAVLFDSKDARCLNLLISAVELKVDKQESARFRLALQRLVQSRESENGLSQLQFSDIQRWVLQSQTLNRFFALAKTSLAKNNRAGFKRTEGYHSPDTYEQGAQEVARGVELVAQLSEAILQAPRPNDGDTMTLDSIFMSDLFIFKSELVKRHGIEDE